MYFCARFLKTDMAQFTEEDKNNAPCGATL